MNILLIVQSKIQNVDQFCNFGHFAVTCREPAFGAPQVGVSSDRSKYVKITWMKMLNYVMMLFLVYYVNDT